MLGLPILSILLIRIQVINDLALHFVQPILAHRFKVFAGSCELAVSQVIYVGHQIRRCRQSARSSILKLTLLFFDLGF